MPVKYKIKKTKIGFGKEKSEAYVGQIQLGDTIKTEKLEEQVALRTMLPQSVVHTVFHNIVASVCHFVEEGNGVRLGELGILRPSINTKSAEEGGDVEVEKIRVRYLPSVKMRKAVETFAIKRIGEGGVVEGETEEEEDDEPTGGNSGGNTGGGGQELS